MRARPRSAMLTAMAKQLVQLLSQPVALATAAAAAYYCGEAGAAAASGRACTCSTAPEAGSQAHRANCLGWQRQEMPVFQQQHLLTCRRVEHVAQHCEA